MGVNHKHKCIFVHIPKNAGCSIVESGICADGYWGHVKLEGTFRLHPEYRGQYFTFCFVRNPRARLVSLYHYFTQLKPGHRWWHSKNEDRQRIVKAFGDFTTFVKRFESSPLAEDFHFSPQADWITDPETGELLVDYVGRCEDLANSWEHVCKTTGFPGKPLGVVNRSEHKPFASYYTPETWDIAGSIYAADFELLPNYVADFPGTRVYLGCGRDKRVGWINVDINDAHKPDIVANAKKLPFESSTVDVMEACHLLEHLTHADAVKALEEAYRVLRDGGRLLLELPNLDRCVEMLKSDDTEEARLGMLGLFGLPNKYFAHLWGWTPETLSTELTRVGFRNVQNVPITQLWRKASAYNRDMRLEATK